MDIHGTLRKWFSQVVGRPEAGAEGNGSGSRHGFRGLLNDALRVTTASDRCCGDGTPSYDSDAGAQVLMDGLYDTVHALGDAFDGEDSHSRAEFDQAALASLVSLLLIQLAHQRRELQKAQPRITVDSNTDSATTTATTVTTTATTTSEHEPLGEEQAPALPVGHAGCGSTASAASGRQTTASANSHVAIIVPRHGGTDPTPRLVLLPSAAVDAQHFNPVDGMSFSDGATLLSHQDSSAGSAAVRSVRMTTHAFLNGDGSSIGSVDSFGGSVGEVNQYLMLKRLGRGAQGEVYLAVDSDTDAVRAIKIIPRPAAGTRVSAARRAKLEHLKREVGIMKRLRHRNVVSLHEVIDDPAADKLYLVMDYIEHGPVATMTDAGAVSRTVDPVLLANYGRQLCAALQYLHRHGVIHRDIKPDNILVGQHDHVFVSDFGVSDAFADGSLARAVSGTRGTPAFLAPELLQAGLEAAAAAATDGSAGSGSGSDEGGPRGKPAAAVDGEAVDTWALGMTLYVLLYGKLPWEFADAQDLFEAIQRRPIELRPQAAVVRAPRPPTSTSDLFLASVASPSGARFMAGGRVAPVAVQASSPPMPAPTAPPESAVNEGSSSPPTPFRRATSHRTPSQHNAREQLGASSNSNSANGASSSNVGALPCFDMENSGIDNTVVVQGEDKGRRPSSTFAASLSDVSVQFGSATSFIVAGSSSTTALGMMPSAAADEGWRRILHGMLQRDPKRRTPLGEVRKQLVTLEVRMEEATRYNASQRSVVDEGAKAAFTARR